MKYYLFIVLISISVLTYAQEYNGRILTIENHLKAIELETPGLNEKINIDINNAALPNFLLAISTIHKVNINISNELVPINIVNNFSDVKVSDVLLFLCKEYNLTIEFTGNILSVKPYQAPEVPLIEKEIELTYNANRESLTLNLKDDLLYKAFRKITEMSGKNLVYSQDLANERLSVFIKDMPFDAALDKMAFSNSLNVSKTRDNFYVFERNNLNEINTDPAGNQVNNSRPMIRPRKSNFYFKILDTINGRLEVDFENTSIANVIYDISNQLNKDFFIATPLEEAGNASAKASDITFDELLVMMFESAENTSGSGQTTRRSNIPNQNGNPLDSSGTGRFSFKKIDGIYYFGTTDQLSIRTVEIIPLMHRSIELMNDPTSTGRTAGRTATFDQNITGINGNQSFNNSTSQFSGVQSRYPTEQSSRESESTEFLEIVPDEIKRDLDIRVDKELNSFLVSGPSRNVSRFKSFLIDIDKPVPVILIEVMILEISRNAKLEAGIEWGIGTEPTTTQGQIYPNTDLKLGANTINRILGRIDGSSFFNIGKVLPDFFATIKAQETNGNFKVKSSPRIATLNGHRAYFSNGQTSYYAVTNQTYFGSQNPTTSEITNYQPIDAELSLDVRPLVSGDGLVTLDIKVIQSNFNGERIAENAPPGLNSREFTSIIKARNNDIIVLGGLEEKSKEDTGTGVPFLSKIPVLKWLFSKRTRTDSNSKLTILIKPTIIY